MKKKEKILTFTILFIILIAASWSLFIKGLGFGHDLNHQARIFEMAEGLKAGNFPVIWSQNLAYGYGMPLFEFYAPLPYFIGALFHLLGFNLTISIKIIIFISNLISLVSSYFLAKEIFKNNKAAIITAAFFTLAPYRAVDLIRSAHSESWSIAFLPLVLLGIIQIVNEKKWGFLNMALAFAAVMLSHNITALISLPFIVLFALIYVFIIKKDSKNKIKKISLMAGSGVLSLALSAFYFIPALLEKKLTQIDTFILDQFYDIGQHFLYIRQFIKPWGDWEYGGSGWGPNDEMSFFLGFAQILVFLIAGIQIVLKLRKKKKENYKLELSFLFISGLTLFMTLLKTQKLWRLIKISSYIQFPWRLLGVYIIFAALTAATSYLLMSKKLKNLYFYSILAVLLIFNTRYFRNEKYIDHSKEYENYQKIILEDRSNNLFDYLPKDLNFFEKKGYYLYKNKKYNEIEVPTTSLFTNEFLRSQKVELLESKNFYKKAIVNSNKEENIRINLAYYPGWTIYLNGEKQETKINENGLMTVNVKEGRNEIEIKLEDTKIRNFSKIISLIAFIIVAIIFYRIRENDERR